MADTALDAGLSEEDFEELLQGLARDSDRAFTDSYSLLVDATAALFSADTAEAGHAALAALDQRPLASLLHRFELSNWVLYARAFGDASPDARARRRSIAPFREAPVSLDWLEREWVRHALGEPPVTRGPCSSGRRLSNRNTRSGARAPARRSRERVARA